MGRDCFTWHWTQADADWRLVVVGAHSVHSAAPEVAFLTLYLPGVCAARQKDTEYQRDRSVD